MQRRVETTAAILAVVVMGTKMLDSRLTTRCTEVAAGVGWNRKSVTEAR